MKSGQADHLGIVTLARADLQFLSWPVPCNGDFSIVAIGFEISRPVGDRVTAAQVFGYFGKCLSDRFHIRRSRDASAGLLGQPAQVIVSLRSRPILIIDIPRVMVVRADGIDCYLCLLRYGDGGVEVNLAGIVLSV